ncbi:heavy metal translocating P-type ATPase [Porticoccaceae bacterium nBUS_17]
MTISSLISSPSIDCDRPTECFHCGEKLDVGLTFQTVIGGKKRSMCCPGCLAVAEMIATHGMEAFYDRRTHYAPPPDLELLDSKFAGYDDPTIRESLINEVFEDSERIKLLITGMTCAACSWLIEKQVLQLSDVRAALVKLGDASLTVDICPNAPLSNVMRAVASLGYEVQPFTTSERNTILFEENKRLLTQLSVAGLGMMQVGMFAIALHAGDIQGMDSNYVQLMRWVSLPIAMFVVSFSARDFFISAWRHLRVGALVMDLPIAVAIATATLASIYATFTSSGTVYFDSVVMVTFFLLIARYFEQRNRFKNSQLLQQTHDNLPLLASRIILDEILLVPTQQIVANDRLRIFHGDIIPVDGELLSGETEVDESIFTGESLPRTVRVGELLFAGTCNLSKSVDIRVTNTVGLTRFDALQSAVASAETKKPRIAKMADAIASYFVAIVLLLSLTSGLIWWWIDASNSFWIALSVLVVSCPCALGLATPTVLTSAASRLQYMGGLIRSENAMEELSRIDYAIFDKTGTLTDGDFECVEIRPTSNFSANDCYLYACALQKYSRHPISSAFRHDSGTSNNQPTNEMVDFIDNITRSDDTNCPVYVTGMGLSFKDNEVEYRLGQSRFIEECVGDVTLPDSSMHWIVLSRGKNILCFFGVRDRLRPNARQMISYFKNNNIKTMILTGDSSQQARSVVQSLNVHSAEFGLSPEDKLRIVMDLQQRGHQVLMVGDGVNDGPVLSHSTVGVAVADATDIARVKADIVFTNSDLLCIEKTHRLAIKARGKILQNFGWAISYNFFAIPMAALGYVQPWAAALGMSLSSLVVVLNSLRLNHVNLENRDI